MDANELTPGRFCWVELGTTDDEAATAFYTSFFEWTVETHDMGGGHGGYSMLRLADKDVGGLYKLMPELLEQGVPPNWLSYVSVESADATTEKATSLGGSVFMGPMDVMDKGRMSVLQDPTGATFAIWEPKSHKGTAAYGEVGATCWNELLTFDTAKAGAFYSSLFGWTLQEQPMGPINYTMLMQGEVPVGGMMTAPPEMGEAPPNWMVYFAVGDCDEQVERGQGLGATVLSPPMDIPEVGRMAVLADPQGGVFSIIKLVQPKG